MVVAEAESDMRADNLAAFARYLPGIAKLLDGHVPQTRLVDNPDGSFDVEFRGQRLYDVAGDGTSPLDVARTDVDAARKTFQGRLLVSPLSSKSLDNTTSVYVTKLLKKGVDRGITFLEVPNDDGAYHLMVMGLGLGYHLTELLTYCKPFSICIVEPNLDFLYHSLSTFDWASLLERRKEWPSAVSVLRAENAEDLSRAMRAHCRNANPVAVDSTLMFSSYPNDMMDQTLRLFRRDAHLIHSGLGFFQDEMEMVRASYFNLVPHEDFRLFKRGSAPIDLPAFVVGSGPSIDDDLDFIKANQDRAVIFSCGSALGVLLANGIRPDFQVQLENGEAPREMLESMAKTYDYTGICLIGSNTISPQTRALFGNRVFFMRQSLSPFAMFSPGYEYSLDHSGPTVTNTGLELALHSGFNDVYLFGCDLGARSPERHHSRFSPYHMADRQAGYDAAVVFAQKLPVRELANFGGVVFTNEIMTWSRDSMETSIKQSGGARRIFNCSDGMRIQGARPQVSDGVKLVASKRTKTDVVGDLMGHWPEASTFGFKDRWHSTDWRGQLRRYADTVIEICKAEPERSQEFLHRVGPLLIPDHVRPPRFEEYCVRGTLFVTLLTADYYSRRVHPPEKRIAFQNDAYAGVVDLLELMLDQTDWFFDHLDEIHTHTDLKNGLNAWKPSQTPLPPA